MAQDEKPVSKEQATRAIKVDFLAPLTGNFTIGYEMVMGHNINLDLRLGIIGLGTDPGDYNPFGAFIKVGPKLLIDQEWTIEGMRRTHPLMGKYIKPEVIFSSFSRDNWSYTWNNNYLVADDNQRIQISSIAVLINYGKQVIVGDKFVFDYHFGLGYNYSTDEDQGWYFSHPGAPPEFPIAVSAGILLGYCF